ncbi:vegetative incompatibility het-e-1 [Fusarium longipes]|uniref:Vegetative incompatibility het-e-1 n=1 Tax=Fusarium longipes TaxID=694270 RepID=A0A395RMG0_9HYPO|nr:vegetative incompatibility het-e-1 [Fusarium longipes]
MSGLEGLGIVANVIAVVDLSLKIISWCSKYAQDVKSSHDGRARLLQAAITLHYEAEKVSELLSSEGATKLPASQKLAHAMGDSEMQLRDLERQLSPKSSRSSLKWPLQKEKVESAIQHIEKTTQSILDILQIDMALFAFCALSKCPVFGENSALYNTDWIVDRGLLISIDDRAEAEGQRAIIDQLPYISDAVWDSHTEGLNATCLPNTRESLLEELEDWIKDTAQPSKTIFWLNGMAGTGKSTISRTLSQRLSQNGVLGATFFFKRGEAGRSGISKLVPTIARQLATNQPALRPYIYEAICNDSTIISKASNLQFNKLVLEPLAKSSGEYRGESSIAIVIDALDECESEADIRLILSLFSTTKDIHCPRPRIFVTSRPDLPVRLGFQDVGGSYKDLILHEIPNSIIGKDISTFFWHKMKLIVQDWNASVVERRKLPKDWPGSERVRLLTERAVPLFIFAATACRFISERQLGDPERQLCRVLDYQTEGTTSQLDCTYRPVLAQFFCSASSEVSERRTISEFRRVIGTIINLLDPLSSSALSRLLDVGQDIIDCKLDLLHSVLSVPSSSDAPVRMLHLSFRDYLTSLDNMEHRFWIDEKKSARNLVKDCLRVMETLQPDICRLKVPGTPRSTLKPEFINACIPPEVQYACLYWTTHQSTAGIGPDDAAMILEFMKRHLLHWIEVLKSIIAIEPTSDGTELVKFLNDAIRFVESYIHTVDLTPLQIYCSVLVLAPHNSIVRRTFATKIPTWLTHVSGNIANWDARLLDFNEISYHTDSVVFSHDSRSLISILQNGDIHIWSCDTGERIRCIELERDKYLPTARQDALEYYLPSPAVPNFIRNS